ncbi:MAG: TonB-dependent receptor [Methyloligella sp. ZOD6]
MFSKIWLYHFARSAKTISLFSFSAFAFFASATVAFGQEETDEAGDTYELDPIVVEAPNQAPTPRPSSSSSRSSRSSAPAPVPAAGPVDTESAAQAAGPSTPAADSLNLNSEADSGSRLGLTPFETPASIDIIPNEEMVERGQQTVHEAVTQDAPGITWLGAPGNGGGSYSARGFDGVNSVMNLYDGTRFYVGSGTITFPFDTWSAERIEVLHGPASVLYGEGAIGGIINVVPKKPTFERINRGQISFDDQGQKRAAWDSGGAIGDKVAYRLNIAGQDTDGWLDQNGDFKDLMIAGSILYEVNPDLKITLSNDYGYQEPLRYFGTPLVDGRVLNGIRFKNYNVDDSVVEFRDNWTQLKAEWTPTENLKFRNTAYYVTSDRHWRNVESYLYRPIANDIFRDVYIEIFHEQEQIGNRFDASLKHDLFGMKNEVLVGFDVNHIDFKHTNNSPYGGSSTVGLYDFSPGRFLRVDPTTPGFKSKTSQASVFAENHLHLTDDISVLAGFRYDAPDVERIDLRDSANNFGKSLDSFSWRVGAVWNPFRNTALYAQYATGADPVTSLITMNVSSADFELSTGRQIEVGIKQTFWNDRAELTLAGYRIEKDNLLTTDPFNSALTVQVGEQSSEGVEAALSVAVTETIRADGNLALLNAQYDVFNQDVGGTVVSYAGNTPRNVPEQVANLWVSWAFAPRWTARGGLQYVGSVYSDYANQYERPSFTVVNAMLDFQVTESSVLSLRGFNLFDEVYAQTGNSNTWRLGQPQTFELTYNIGF